MKHRGTTFIVDFIQDRDRGSQFAHKGPLDRSCSLTYYSPLVAIAHYPIGLRKNKTHPPKKKKNTFFS